MRLEPAAQAGAAARPDVAAPAGAAARAEAAARAPAGVAARPEAAARPGAAARPVAPAARRARRHLPGAGDVGQPVRQRPRQERDRHRYEGQRRVPVVVSRQHQQQHRLLRGRRQPGLHSRRQQQRRAQRGHVLRHDDRRPARQEERVRPHLELGQAVHVPVIRQHVGLLRLAPRHRRRAAAGHHLPRARRRRVLRDRAHLRVEALGQRHRHPRLRERGARAARRHGAQGRVQRSAGGRHHQHVRSHRQAGGLRPQRHQRLGHVHRSVLRHARLLRRLGLLRRQERGVLADGVRDQPRLLPEDHPSHDRARARVREPSTARPARRR